MKNILIPLFIGQRSFDSAALCACLCKTLNRTALREFTIKVEGLLIRSIHFQFFCLDKYEAGRTGLFLE